MATKKISVGLASCGVSAGGDAVYEKAEELLTKYGGKDIELGKTGCVGACFREVLVDVEDEKGRRTYADVTPEILEEIFEKDLHGNSPLDSYIMKDSHKNNEASYFEKQRRIVLRNTGEINPEVIDDYIARDGYRALEKAVSMSPEEVLEEMRLSGLRGRGGAGFPTHLKWKLTAEEEGNEKYVVCNADEGDPGAFMDRSVLEGDPHSLIEGMAIIARTIGAGRGYIYVRAEYPLAIERLTIALTQAREKGFLGESIFNSDFSFDIELKIGAGAFVCGEETALIASIEGQRGMPRIKPPFPAAKGVWMKPTVINNVETIANVPYIILHGGADFASVGTEKSRGTKVFALTGKIKKSGLVEVPMGITLREVIFEIGGGIKGDKSFKAVQLGGPSGGCLPAEELDTPVDYESLQQSGAIVGSGGMVVMDEDTCMVDVARFFMNFIREESCGKCTFCRVGTTRMYEILERITEGEGRDGDIERLLELGEKIKESSLCGLGQTAANPVLTTIRYFRHEYEEHIKEKKCRAKVCKPLLTYTIDPVACTGCTLCAKNCPVDAISGSLKEIHTIDQDLCIQCGNCVTACNFNAVNVE